MTAVSLRLLGAPSIDRAGRLELLPLNTPTSLLFYLAVAGDWVSRHELAYLYRPDDPEAAALAYLRLQLHRAQQYPWAEGLEVGPLQARWQVSSDLAELRAAHRRQDWPAVIAAYTGTLLDGVGMKDKPTYGSWLELERDGAQQLYRGALEAEARRLGARGAHADAVGLYRRLVGLDELDEGSMVSLLRALALSGQREQALRQYTTFEEMLEREMGMEPADETRALAEQIRMGSLSASAPGKVARDPLPQPTTRFIGRETELGELASLLEQPECRLLTMVGLGGAGKTRLALELARQQRHRFPDGVHHLPLLGVEDAGQAMLHLAQAVGLELAPQSEVEEQLLGHLAGFDGLLLLDNVEQVRGLPAFVARLLASSPRLKLLATSRESLKLQGEWLYDLKGLAYPSDAAPLSEVAHPSDAAELFLSAARRVSPRLTLGQEDMQQVARICRQVEGLPLALELAAAWVRAMPLHRIADEIARSFALLEADLVDLPERHRSVKAVLDKTWADLSRQKAETLAKLAVFDGGCSLEAAEAVSGGQLTILLSLVNQSLLHRDAAGRFSSHPLVAQYAAGVLAADPERLAHSLDAHADHYAELLHSYDPKRRMSPDGSLRTLETDIANVEKAWFRLLARGDHQRMAEVVETLLTYYNVLGQYQRGSAIGARTLGELPADAPGVDRLRCSIQLAMSTMARESGLLQTALEHAEAALATAEAHGLSDAVPRAQRYLGDVQQMMGRFAEAETAYQRAYGAFSALGDTGEMANTLNSLASLEAVQENFEAATERFLHCVELFEQVGDELAKAIALNNLGYLADAQGQQELASQRYEASLVSFERIQFTRGIAAIKNNLVVLYGVMGRLDEAEAMGRESLRLKEEMEDRLGIIITLKNLGDVQLMRQSPQRAMDYFLPAIRMAVDIQAIPRLLQVLPGYAEALSRMVQDDGARQVYEALARHPLTPPSARERAFKACPDLAGGPTDDEAPLQSLLRDLGPRLAELSPVV